MKFWCKNNHIVFHQVYKCRSLQSILSVRTFILVVFLGCVAVVDERGDYIVNVLLTVGQYYRLAPHDAFLQCNQNMRIRPVWWQRFKVYITILFGSINVLRIDHLIFITKCSFLWRSLLNIGTYAYSSFSVYFQHMKFHLYPCCGECRDSHFHS